jgi:hypothetical protein
MKTLRKILLERHQDAESQLDAVRLKALAALTESGSADMPLPARRGALLFRLILKAWQELIWPSRRAWAGFAALWLAVLVANLEMKAASPGASVVQSAPPREVVQALAEQQRLLAELLPPITPPPVKAPPRDPRPRSERPRNLKAC